MDSPYRDVRLASADITELRALEVDINDFRERVMAAFESLHHPDAKKECSDFLDGLQDLVADHISPIRNAARAHYDDAMARIEREHIRRAKAAPWGGGNAP